MKRIFTILSLSVMMAGTTIASDVINTGNGDVIFSYTEKAPARANGEVVYRDVTLTEAGTLASTLGEVVNDLDSLVVRGPINGADFNTLWSATFYGHLKVIDLGEALPENEAVPANAFWNESEQIYDGAIHLSGLRKVILPKKLKTIGEKAFNRAAHLEEVVFPEEMESIGEKAFLECWSLKGDPLVLPEGLTEIPMWCFYFCMNLKEVVLPSTMKHIRNGGFWNCAEMRRINLPHGLLSIGENGFSGTALEEVTIPSTCKEFIGGDQFSVNNYLKKVVIEYGMSVMPRNFLESSSLTEIEIPSSVEAILRRALYNCNLESLSLPEGFMWLETEALRGCSELRTLELPSTMRSLGVCTCYSMSSLEEITCKAPIPPVCGVDPTNCDDALPEITGNITFSGIPNDIPVYVPVGTAELYKTTYGWDYFTNFIEKDFQNSFSEVGKEVPTVETPCYDLTGMKVDRPIPGHIYIRNGKKIVF